MQFFLHSQKHQSGFTLVELIMVLVIMVIVSAFALPKMTDMSGNAKVTVTENAVASANSALDFVYQQALIAGQTGDTGEVNGIPLVYGYPKNLVKSNLWLELSGFEKGAINEDLQTNASELIIMKGDSRCYFEYTPANDTSPAYFDIPEVSTCGE